VIDLGRDTIFVTLAGSHAHGTAGETSDIDLRGVCLQRLADRLSLSTEFEQFEGPIPESLGARLAVPAGLSSASVPPKTEGVIYELAKFLRLCAAGNPNALEVLFAAEEDWLLSSPLWLRLHAERRGFLSRKVQQTYVGYAVAQLRKIRTHRSWLLDPPQSKPTREAYGLPSTSTLGRDDQNRIEQAIAAKVRAYGIDDLELPKATRIALADRLQAFWMDARGPRQDGEESAGGSGDPTADVLREVATEAVGLPPATVAVLNAERRYRAAMKHWESYEIWQAERNPARAELERRHGYDTKHAMHLVRLMKTGLELLQTAELVVRRPDADELIAIRQGALDFTELERLAAGLQQALDTAASSSTLPADVDRTWVDALAFELFSA
jgi:predicted nucleotidyltransferase